MRRFCFISAKFIWINHFEFLISSCNPSEEQFVVDQTNYPVKREIEQKRINFQRSRSWLRETRFNCNPCLRWKANFNGLLYKIEGGSFSDRTGNQAEGSPFDQSSQSVGFIFPVNQLKYGQSIALSKKYEKGSAKLEPASKNSFLPTFFLHVGRWKVYDRTNANK
jgi:hypothetical protein